MNSVVCPICSGKKITHKVVQVDCPGCQGKGIIDSGSCIGTCGTCFGLKKIWKQSSEPCVRCNGTGTTKF